MLPPINEIEYLTNEAVVTKIIPRQPRYQPNPIAIELRYAKQVRHNEIDMGQQVNLEELVGSKATPMIDIQIPSSA